MTGKWIFIWPPGSLWHWPWCVCLEPTDLSDLDDTDEEVDIELLSLSNPQSGEGEGDEVSAAHGSHAASSCDPGCIVFSGLSQGVMSDEYA